MRRRDDATYISGYELEDFLRDGGAASLGWAVEGQFQRIVYGDDDGSAYPLEEMNPNALRQIAEFCERQATRTFYDDVTREEFADVATEIRDYLAS